MVIAHNLASACNDVKVIGIPIICLHTAFFAFLDGFDDFDELIRIP